MANGIDLRDRALHVCDDLTLFAGEAIQGFIVGRLETCRRSGCISFSIARFAPGLPTQRAHAVCLMLRLGDHLRRTSLRLVDHRAGFGQVVRKIDRGQTL
jgi:hypothetical protein